MSKLTMLWIICMVIQLILVLKYTTYEKKRNREISFATKLGMVIKFIFAPIATLMDLLLFIIALKRQFDNPKRRI